MGFLIFGGQKMNLKEARFKKDMTQFDLRILTGIHQSRISYIERGYVVPRDDEKQKIETALGLRISWDETGRIRSRTAA
jgi:transcriptional regulator with XRE-family HTH domain